MMPASDHYLCDLCFYLRRGKLRVFGVRFVDGYWACAACEEAYRMALVNGGESNAGAVRA